MANTEPSKQGQGRGFASMDEEKQRSISRKGGESVPAEKRSFSQDRELASQAGRKGGKASHASRNKQQGATRTEPQDRENEMDEESSGNETKH